MNAELEILGAEAESKQKEVDKTKEKSDKALRSLSTLSTEMNRVHIAANRQQGEMDKNEILIKQFRRRLEMHIESMSVCEVELERVTLACKKAAVSLLERNREIEALGERHESFKKLISAIDRDLANRDHDKN